MREFTSSLSIGNRLAQSGHSPKAEEEDVVSKSAAAGASVAAFSGNDSVELRGSRAAGSRAGKRSSSTGKKIKQMKRLKTEDVVLKSAAAGASVAAFSGEDSVELRGSRAAGSRDGKLSSSTGMKKKIKHE
jgi:hypothetical protein